MNEPKFKPGDMAWSPGSGFAICEDLAHNATYPIRHGCDSYTNKGFRVMVDQHPTLLTVEEAAKLGYYPPKPKVKKTIEAWVNVYPDNIGIIAFPSKAEADTGTLANRIACVKVTGEYEVEE